MADNVLEALGFCMLIGFAYFVWPPATLLVAGLVLLVVANVRSGRRARAKTPGPGALERIVRAWLAAKGVER